METKEDKKQYFQGLRDGWKKAKDLVNDPEYKAKFQVLMSQAPDFKVSATGFAFCLNSMKRNSFEGLPYLDCKTFAGWKQSGFMVKKGEKSKIDGLTWIASTKENEKGEKETSGMYPKGYRLFHKTQVEAL